MTPEEQNVDDYLIKSQFGVYPVQYHVHDGTGSPRMDANNLVSLPVHITGFSLTASNTIFVNDNVSGNYKLVGVSRVFATPATSGSFQIEVCTGTQPVGGGSTQLITALPLTGGTNTAVFGSVVPNPTVINAGARVNTLITAGSNLTGMTNLCVMVTLWKLS